MSGAKINSYWLSWLRCTTRIPHFTHTRIYTIQLMLQHMETHHGSHSPSHIRVKCPMIPLCGCQVWCMVPQSKSGTWAPTCKPWLQGQDQLCCKSCYWWRWASWSMWLDVWVVGCHDHAQPLPRPSHNSNPSPATPKLIAVSQLNSRHYVSLWPRTSPYHLPATCPV